MSSRGIFITFEGTDGCGKSTQVKELRRRIQRCQEEVILTREPGGTVVGEAIRKVLQNVPETGEIDPLTELFLFAASRKQLVKEVLEPALERGTHVIADRFLDSTTVYQGAGRGLDRAMVAQVNRYAVGNCLPDITFLMDMDAGLSRERVISRQHDESIDHIEKLPLEFYEKIRQGYLELAALEPQRVVVLDATQKIGEISEQIWLTLSSRFDGVLG